MARVDGSDISIKFVKIRTFRVAQTNFAYLCIFWKRQGENMLVIFNILSIYSKQILSRFSRC